MGGAYVSVIILQCEIIMLTTLANIGKKMDLGLSVLKSTRLVLTVLLNREKRTSAPKINSIESVLLLTLIFNDFEMFCKKLFVIKTQKGGVSA